MTIPYNATKFTCLKNVILNLTKLGIKYYELSFEDKIKINEFVFAVYDSIKINLIETFYLKQKLNYKKFEYYDNECITINETIQHSDYKNKDKYTHKILIKKNLNEKKTLIAAEANNMHYLDSNLINYLNLMELPFISIHDCIGVELKNICFFMDKINYYYKKELNKQNIKAHYSINIFK